MFSLTSLIQKRNRVSNRTVDKFKNNVKKVSRRVCEKEFRQDMLGQEVGQPSPALALRNEKR